MKQRDVIVWGAGGHAIVVAEILRLAKRWRIIGFLDDVDSSRKGREFCGATILGDFRGRTQWGAFGTTCLALGVGDCAARLKMVTRAASQGLYLATAAHPSSVISSEARLGEGTIVAAGAVINSGTMLGRGRFVNTSASVDHHCSVGYAAHISPGVRLAGDVSIGRGDIVGTGPW